MNFNALIAVLVIKQIITQDEGEKLVEHLHDKPQSTELRDAIAAVGEIIGAPVASTVAAALGPVGPEQAREELAARSAQPTSPAAPESPQVAANNAENTGNETGRPEADLGANATPTASPAPTTDDDKTADTTSDESDKSEADKSTSTKKSSKK